MISSRRFFLKEQTWNLHQKVESLLDLNLIFRSQTLYSVYLQSHLDILVKHAHNLSLVSLPDFLQEGLRKRIEALNADLSQLRSSHAADYLNSEIGLHSKKLFFDSFDESPKTQANLIGFSYVVEGSAFGATLIKKWAMENGQTEATTHFFDINMSTSRANWSNFLEFLEQLPDQDLDMLLSGAIAGFQEFENAFMRIQQSESYQSLATQG